jgi:hypothetical protein
VLQHPGDEWIAKARALVAIETDKVMATAPGLDSFSDAYEVFNPQFSILNPSPTTLDSRHLWQRV